MFLPTKDLASPHTLSDETLIARIARGDPAALETLYDRHAALVLAVCLRVTQDRALAEAVLPEVFWHVWQQAVHFQISYGPFKGRLLQLARQLSQQAAAKLDRN